MRHPTPLFCVNCYLGLCIWLGCGLILKIIIWFCYIYKVIFWVYIEEGNLLIHHQCATSTWMMRRQSYCARTPPHTPAYCWRGDRVMKPISLASYLHSNWLQIEDLTKWHSFRHRQPIASWLRVFFSVFLSWQNLTKCNNNKKTTKVDMCDLLCEVQAKVSKSNYEKTSIKVWFLPLISL